MSKLDKFLVAGQNELSRSIAAAAQGRPWINWFGVQEWSSLTTEDSIVSHPTVLTPSHKGFSQSFREYSLKRALVSSNYINVMRPYSEVAEEVDKFREAVIYRWEQHLRKSYSDLSSTWVVDGVRLQVGEQPYRALAPSDMAYASLLLEKMGVVGPKMLVCDIDTLVPDDVGLAKVVDERPRRWRVSALGEWEEVLPYLDVVGSDLVENPEYKDAPIQDYPVIVHDVMGLLVPKQSGSEEFDKRSWMGSVRWTNILDKETNPDGMRGRFFATPHVAIKPLKTELAITIRALRS